MSLKLSKKDNVNQEQIDAAIRAAKDAGERGFNIGKEPDLGAEANDIANNPDYAG